MFMEKYKNVNSFTMYEKWEMYKRNDPPLIFDIARAWEPDFLAAPAPDFFFQVA